MKRTLARRYAALICLLLSSAAIWWYLTRMSTSPQTHPTALVHRGDIENTITAVGTLQPSKYVDVGAQVSGQLQSLRVKVGDMVKAGQLLAEIDPRVYLARVSEAKATLENLRAQLKIKMAQLDLSVKQLTRNKALLEQDAFAEAEVEISEASLSTANAESEAINAQIDQSEAALQSARVNLEYTKITAPMAGTVVSITAREGQTLNANQQTPIILRIADMDVMTVWTQVSEADVLRLEKGQEAYFTVLGQTGRHWQGRLLQILPTPEIVNNVTFYNALFDVPNAGNELRVQMTAQVFFVLEKAQQVLLAPVSALSDNALRKGSKKGSRLSDHQKNETAPPEKGLGREYSVEVLKTDGVVEERAVMVGVMNPVYAEIISGLQEGETVITGMAATSAKAAGGARFGAGNAKGSL